MSLAKWFGGVVLASLLAAFAFAQTPGGFSDGLPLCANTPNPNCPGQTLGLNQAFQLKADFPPPPSRTIINVTDPPFNAKCDGATDDSSAFSAAILAASLLQGGGGVVQVPSGVCIAQSVSMLSFVTLQGVGRTATIIKGKSGTAGGIIATQNFGILTGTNTVGGPFKWAIRNLTIDGNKAARASGDGLDIYGYDFLLEDIDVRNAPGIDLYSEWSTSSNVPVASGGDGMEARVVNVRAFSAGGNGITWNGPHDSQFVNVLSYINTGMGFDFGTTANFSAAGMMLSNVHAYGNNNWGIRTNSLLFVKGVTSESNLAGGGLQVNTGGFLVGGSIATFNNVGPGTQLNSGANNNVLSSLYSNLNSGAGGIGVQIASNNNNIGNIYSLNNSQQGVLVSGSGNTLPGIQSLLNTGVGVSNTGNNNTIENVFSTTNSGGGISVANGVTQLRLTGESTGNTGTQLALGALGAQNSIDMVVTAGAQTSWTGTVGTNNINILSDKNDSINNRVAANSQISLPDATGHFGYKGSQPTLTGGCNGAGSFVSGNDNAGFVGGQTAAATSCTLTFAHAFSTTPSCIAMGNTGPLTGAVTIGSANLIVNFPSTGAFVWSYQCQSIN